MNHISNCGDTDKSEGDIKGKVDRPASPACQPQNSENAAHEYQHRPDQHSDGPKQEPSQNQAENQSCSQRHLVFNRPDIVLVKGSPTRMKKLKILSNRFLLKEQPYRFFKFRIIFKTVIDEFRLTVFFKRVFEALLQCGKRVLGNFFYRQFSQVCPKHQHTVFPVV